MHPWKPLTNLPCLKLPGARPPETTKATPLSTCKLLGLAQSTNQTLKGSLYSLGIGMGVAGFLEQGSEFTLGVWPSSSDSKCASHSVYIANGSGRSHCTASCSLLVSAFLGADGQHGTHLLVYDRI